MIWNMKVLRRFIQNELKFEKNLEQVHEQKSFLFDLQVIFNFSNVNFREL